MGEQDQGNKGHKMCSLRRRCSNGGLKTRCATMWVVQYLALTQNKVQYNLHRPNQPLSNIEFLEKPCGIS
jgi:hypothetical protein